MNFLRAVSSVSVMVIASRILGLIREILMTRYLGAGAVADAFFVAFKLPNFFRRLFAEGAFSAGFVPLFSAALGQEITDESRARAQALANDVLSWFLPILVLILAIMEAFMVPVMLGLTGGYGSEGANKFALTVLLGRFTFPFLLFISLVAFLTAILNAFDRFALAAGAPLLLNIVMISALLLAPDDQTATARWLAVAVSLAGLAQMLLLLLAVRKLGIKLAFKRPRLSKDVKAMWALVLPAAFGAGVIQLNLLIDVVLAARFLEDGAVSWLFYAERLNQLAVGVVGVAIGTVLLPRISRAVAGGDTASAVSEQNGGLVLGMLLTLPAATALMILPLSFVTVLFERGAFTGGDSLMTASALLAYASGLPAYVLVKIFTPGFHGRQDTKTPVRIALVALAVNLSANLALIGPLGHMGLALATALASWINAALLFLVLVIRKQFYFTRHTLWRMCASVVASGAMAVVLYRTNGEVSHLLTGELWDQILGLGLLVGSGLVSYFTAAFLLGAFDRSILLRLIRRITGRVGA